MRVGFLALCLICAYANPLAADVCGLPSSFQPVFRPIVAVFSGCKVPEHLSFNDQALAAFFLRHTPRRGGLSDIPVKIRPVFSSSIGAYARTDGEILLTSRMLAELTSPAEFVFVLGHELSHLRGVAPDCHLSTAECHQVGEIDADAEAVKLLQRNGYSPASATKLLERLAADPSLPAWKASALKQRGRILVKLGVS